MPRPEGLSTQIFLDSGDPEDTKKALALLGFLDGQTTNPSLVAKNPALQEKIASGIVLNGREVDDFYKGVVQEISSLIPDGSVSVEVYADTDTNVDTMLTQAREMFAWIPNAHIKFPTTQAGLEAANIFVKENGRVNMTLVFSQEQCAAVYAATADAHRGDVFVSPFVGRLDDTGVDGMSLIENALTMYASGDGHVQVLVASVRNMDHFLYSLHLKADIITCPMGILEEWASAGTHLPPADYAYPDDGHTPIPFNNINLTADWRLMNITHALTDTGIERFASDWNKLIGNH